MGEGAAWRVFVVQYVQNFAERVVDNGEDAFHNALHLNEVRK